MNGSRRLLLATLLVGGVPMAASRPAEDGAVYVASLRGLNPTAAGGAPAGEARFEIRGDSLDIHVEMRGVPSGIEHWQHFHGFPDGRPATCPSQGGSDANGDGYVDIRETEPTSGTTMVPFNADPPALEIPTHTYPHANGEGGYAYDRTVSVAELQTAFGRKFGGGLDLDHRVVQVHGVPVSTPLPGSVASLGDIPARVTLPIACGQIRRLR